MAGYPDVSLQPKRLKARYNCFVLAGWEAPGAYATPGETLYEVAVALLAPELVTTE